MLGGYCPVNSPQEIDIDKELDIDQDKDINFDGLNDNFYFISSNLKSKNLIQDNYSEYNEVFKRKGIYFENTEFLPEYLITQIKLYQIAVKRLFDNKQTELLDKVTLKILERVFGNVLKSKNIEDIIEYYIKSLINELAK